MFANKMPEIQGGVFPPATSTGQRQRTRSRMSRPNVWVGITVAPLVLLLLALGHIECASLSGSSNPGLFVANHQRQQANPGLMRFRRQAPSGTAYSTGNKLQQLELEEQTMKRQLPELIAQAHQDKSVERALLRMLINASLRSNLDASGLGQRTSWPAPSDTPASLMDGESPLLAASGRRPEFIAGGESNSPLSEAELGSLMATIDQLNAGQLQPIDQSLMGPQQSYPMMDKREYIKPCSFNAISCVRTPFRKL